MPANRFQLCVICIALTLLFTAPAIARTMSCLQDTSNIIGVWRGTSICTDRKIAPACKDEQIIYTFRNAPGQRPGKVILKADKVVDGKIEFMGELEGTFDQKKHTWTAEFRSPRFHGLWSFVISGRNLTGTLTDIPSKATIRKISARKD